MINLFVRSVRLKNAPINLSFIMPESSLGGGVVDYIKEKEKSLNRPASERMGPGVVDLVSIEAWSTYFSKNCDKLRQRKVADYRSMFNLNPYGIDPSLNGKVSIWRGDITKLCIDSIVNAANKTLLGGGGVDGAIHRTAGKYLLQECRTLNGCETGNAKITGGYELPSKYVIHTVGPVGEKPELLQSCYETCLRVAVQNSVRSVAFPCISTGIYGYPQSKAAVVAIRTVRQFLEQNAASVDRIIFCLFLSEDVEIYETLMQVFFPVE